MELICATYTMKARVQDICLLMNAKPALVCRQPPRASDVQGGHGAGHNQLFFDGKKTKCVHKQKIQPKLIVHIVYMSICLKHNLERTCRIQGTNVLGRAKGNVYLLPTAQRLLCGRVSMLESKWRKGNIFSRLRFSKPKLNRIVGFQLVYAPGPYHKSRPLIKKIHHLDSFKNVSPAIAKFSRLKAQETHAYIKKTTKLGCAPNFFLEQKPGKTCLCSRSFFYCVSPFLIVN